MTQKERLIKESPSGKDFEDVLDFVKNTQDIEQIKKVYLEEIKVQIWLNDFVDYINKQDHKLYIEASEHSNQFIQLY